LIYSATTAITRSSWGVIKIIIYYTGTSAATRTVSDLPGIVVVITRIYYNYIIATTVPAAAPSIVGAAIETIIVRITPCTPCSVRIVERIVPVSTSAPAPRISPAIVIAYINIPSRPSSIEWTVEEWIIISIAEERIIKEWIIESRTAIHTAEANARKYIDVCSGIIPVILPGQVNRLVIASVILIIVRIIVGTITVIIVCARLLAALIRILLDILRIYILLTVIFTGYSLILNVGIIL
jgi:hypothetical protein